MVDFIIIGGICLCLVVISIYLIKRKKAGKSGCSCSGCENCSTSDCGKLPYKKQERD